MIAYIEGDVILGGPVRVTHCCRNLFEQLQVSQRETEAARQDVEEARRAAEAASRAKSSFLAVMSHEIRTSMNAVLGLSSSLLESNFPEEQRKLARTIHDSGDSLLEILNDILDYSKLEAGELTFEAIAFTPRDIVEGAVGIIEPRASAKGLKIASKQATVKWAVTDTGMGIAPDRISQLFKDFVQADCSINRRFGGSGLELSICKRIIEQMGGEVGIDSSLGQGTTVRFTTTLPITERSNACDKHDSAHSALEAYAASLNRPLRILIVSLRRAPPCRVQALHRVSR